MAHPEIVAAAASQGVNILAPEKGSEHFWWPTTVTITDSPGQRYFDLQNDSTKPLGKVIRIDESEICCRLDELVRGTVEETLNAMLDAEADESEVGAEDNETIEIQ